MSNNHDNTENKKKVYTTTNGHTLTLVGVSPMFIAKLQSAGTIPPVPKKVIPLDLPGVTQEEDLTEDSIETEEEQKAWDEYVSQRDKVLAMRNDNFMKAIFAKGVEIAASDSDLEEWRQEQAFWGVEVPEHKIDLKVEYIQTELVGGMEDIVQIITGVLSLSGVPQEELAEMEAMFRGALRQRTPEPVANT